MPFELIVVHCVLVVADGISHPPFSLQCLVYVTSHLLSNLHHKNILCIFGIFHGYPFLKYQGVGVRMQDDR